MKGLLHSTDAFVLIPRGQLKVALMGLWLLVAFCKPAIAADIFHDGFEGGFEPVSKPLNDTGITWSGSHPNGNSSTCNPADPAGQDCHYGRDAAAMAGTLQKVGGGGAGFDYTKISNSGNELPASAVLGDGPGDWACTRDNVTGLVWEVKTTSGLRSMAHTYSWHDSNSPDGNPGTGNGGACENPGRCDTGRYVQDVNAIQLCGYNDWHMPTIKGLESIVDFGRSNPAIDPGYFPNTPSWGVWSGSPYAGSSSSAWGVRFHYGYADENTRDSFFRVRLARGGQ